ncbi:MAG: peptidylprolyl isomerase, partial [Endomicrobium sp.]|nr:peptidylprolyl isomerase [Endomicrobium sp.]
PASNPSLLAALNEKLSTTPAEYQKYAATPLGRKQFIDAVVREAIVMEAAKREGIEKRAEYKKAVSDFKEEQDKQFNDYKNVLLIETCIKGVHEKIKSTDEDIQKYYDDNKDSFENPVAYVVKHILVSDLQTAQNAYERLRSGKSFEKIAKEVSQDTGSAANGGLIGPFKKGALVPELENVVVSLKNNEMSGVVKSPSGYHIILKVSEQKLPTISFDEAKERIKRTLEKNRFDAWFTQEKQKLGVEVNYDVAVPTSVDEGQK